MYGLHISDCIFAPKFGIHYIVDPKDFFEDSEAENSGSASVEKDSIELKKDEKNEQVLKDLNLKSGGICKINFI